MPDDGVPSHPFPSTQRLIGALWGMAVGDALALPGHLYYNPRDIVEGYGGWITDYMEPSSNPPQSILTLAATDTRDTKDVMDDLFSSNASKFNTTNKDFYYHKGLDAGDSSLNTLLALDMLHTLQRVDPDTDLAFIHVQESAIENYLKYIKSDSYNDNLVDVCHRLFLVDRQAEEYIPSRGPSLLQFADRRYKSMTAEDDRLAVLSSLLLAIPWILHYASLPEQECIERATETSKLIYPTPSLVPYVGLFAQLLCRLVHGGDTRTEVLAAASHPAMGKPNKANFIRKFSEKAKRLDPAKKLRFYQECAAKLGLSGRICGGLTTVLFLAYEFHDDFSEAVLTNANCGGESIHRGALLGAILAAKMGVPEKWTHGLCQADTIHTLARQLRSQLESRIESYNESQQDAQSTASQDGVTEDQDVDEDLQQENQHGNRTIVPDNMIAQGIHADTASELSELGMESELDEDLENAFEQLETELGELGATIGTGPLREANLDVE